MNEIATVMRNLGYQSRMEDVKKLAAAVDTDGNGTIEFDEFVGMMAQRILKTDGVSELEMAFAVLFDDNSG